MGSQTNVYTVLKAYANTLATLTGFRIAYLDEEFEASVDPTGTFVPFLQSKLFRNVPAWQGMSGGRLDQGLFQVDVVWPRGKDPAGAMAAIDQIVLNKLQGQYLGGRVKVQKAAWAASPLVESDRTIHPITIPWAV